MDSVFNQIKERKLKATLISTPVQKKVIVSEVFTLSKICKEFLINFEKIQTDKVLKTSIIKKIPFLPINLKQDLLEIFIER